jgi:hypothetical protein
MNETRFQAAYPVIHDILETTLRPDVDSYNLLEVLHRILLRAHPERAKVLVEEFDRLSKDDSFSAAELTAIFNQDVPPECALMQESTVAAVIFSLAEYMRYLYQHERLSQKRDASAPPA